MDAWKNGSWKLRLAEACLRFGRYYSVSIHDTSLKRNIYLAIIVLLSVFLCRSIQCGFLLDPALTYFLFACLLDFFFWLLVNVFFGRLHYVSFGIHSKTVVILSTHSSA